MDGSRIKSIDWDEREYGYFNLSDGHWCYGYQIVDLLDDENEKNEKNEEICAHIIFTGDIYINGKSLDEIKRRFYSLPIFSEDSELNR